jgi:hypothetical protein
VALHALAAVRRLEEALVGVAGAHTLVPHLKNHTGQLCVFVRNLYVFVRKPFVFARKPFVFARKPFVFVRKPFVFVRKLPGTYVFVRKPCVFVRTLYANTCQ